MREKRRFKIIVYVLIIAILFVLLFPFFVMLSTSLKSIQEVYASPPHWIPHKFAWQNFIYVWERYPLAKYFINSLIIASFATILNIIVCIPGAYAVSRLRFRGRKPLLFLFLIVQMFSPVIVVIPLFQVIVKIGLHNRLSSLILVNTVFTLAFSIWMLNGYFSGISKEIEEAALIDGCSRLKTIVHIILPIAMPGIVTVIIYTFIWSWNEFMFALTFIDSMDRRPLTVGLYHFIGRWETQWHYLMAAAFMAIIPVILLFTLIEKQLVKGLSGGAVKG